ncbi:MAG: HAD-IC family P-type ATPase, partial [Thermodesulfovibrionales bacterium]|nr:HAD-IC family P-type ATPase [Thermodesulfovibrionales bacterium]
PMVREIVIIDKNFDKTQVLQLSASLERHSEHCIAKAILQSARGINLLDIASVEIKPGRGIKTVFNSEIIILGNRQFMIENQIMIDKLPDDLNDFEKEGNSIIFLAKGTSLVALFVLSDMLKENLIESIGEIRKFVKNLYILSGDNIIPTSTIADKLGIANSFAEMTPQQKQEFIRKIQGDNHRVMMIGDGINDAPSLKEAFVGVSMARGTSVAMESADIVLTRDDFMLIPILLKLSNKTYSIIKQNIFMSFVYNIVAVPIAMIGLLHPIIAASAMAVSSLCVVMNSLRIRK